jgi:hypothetical protein
MGTSIWTWIGPVTHSTRGGTSWQHFWIPQKQRASKHTIRHRHGTPKASTRFDLAREVANPATEVTNPAAEVTNPATDVADSAKEVANLATEVTDSENEVTDSATVPTTPTHAVPTQNAWTTCTRMASRTHLKSAGGQHHGPLPGHYHDPSGGGQKHLIKLNQQPFKAILREALELALGRRDWSGIYAIRDVEEVHKFITDGIHAALNLVAPVKEIFVRTGSNLYLTRETLKMMKRRDSARAGTPRFQVLRNASNRLVKRDKLASNTETLSKASSNPRVLWQLANKALGKAPASLLPALVNAAGNMTSGKRKAAETINAYFISKVDSLLAASESAASDAIHLATDASDSALDTADKARDVPDLAREVADKTRDPADKATDVPDPARESAKLKGRSFKFTVATAGKSRRSFAA